MKKKYLFGLLIGTMALTGCSSEDGPMAKDENKENPEQEQVAEVATPYKDINFSTKQLLTADKAMEFAGDLFLKIAEKETDNALLSPMGVHVILSMLANGADEATQAEILSVLGLTDLEDINSYYNLVTSALKEADNQVTFSSLNSLWTDFSFTPKQNYVDLLGNTFAAEAFKDNLPTVETKDRINEWCAVASNNLIPEFLDKPLDAETVMVLINALYFNGKWTNPFEKEETTKETFYGTSKQSEVEMMHAHRSMECSRVNNGVIVSLPYGNKTFRLNIFLPDEGIEINDCLQAMKDLKPTVASEEVILSTPKFNVEAKMENLAEQIISLGITGIFKPGHLPNIHEELFINKILQKTFLSVNESGAEAAAITATVGETSAGEEEVRTLTINLNRPFMFNITAYDKVVLFSGLVRDL